MFKKFHPVWLKIYLIKTVLYSPHVRSLGACYFLKMVSPRSMLGGNLKNIFTFFINCSNSPPGWSFEIDEEDVNKLLENENIQVLVFNAQILKTNTDVFVRTPGRRWRRERLWRMCSGLC